MKKKGIILIAILALAISVTGCSTSGSSTSDEPEDTIQVSEPTENTHIEKSDGIDVDLTILSSTMVYGEVFNITVNPKDYLGKTIKLRGEYYASFYDETQKYYHYAIIADAAACCEQGLEFILDGDYTYPEDYPENGKQVEFTGVIDSYEELGLTYYYILVSDFKVL